MSKQENPSAEYTIVMDAAAMETHLRRMAHEIAENNPAADGLVLLGILRRGRPLAERLAAYIADLSGCAPPVGSLATTLYRDDVRSGAGSSKPRGQTHFDFNVDGQTVILVDDVLAAGRTIRAALDEVMDYGRPERIQLACLIDRGGRELPIQADYLGWTVTSAAGEWVMVRLKEMDEEDVVLIQHRSGDIDREGD